MTTLSQYQDHVSKQQAQLNRIVRVARAIGKAMNSTRHGSEGPTSKALQEGIARVLTTYGLMESFPQLPQEIDDELTKVLAEDDVVYRYYYEYEVATVAAWRALNQYGDELMSEHRIAQLHELFDAIHAKSKAAHAGELFIEALEFDEEVDCVEDILAGNDQ